MKILAIHFTKGHLGLYREISKKKNNNPGEKWTKP
jgi:hypothetical protein